MLNSRIEQPLHVTVEGYYDHSVLNRHSTMLEKERNPLQRGHVKDIGSTVGEAFLSLIPIHGGGKTNEVVLVTRCEGPAVYIWPRVVHSTEHLLRSLAHTRTRTTPFAIL